MAAAAMSIKISIVNRPAVFLCLRCDINCFRETDIAAAHAAAAFCLIHGKLIIRNSDRPFLTHCRAGGTQNTVFCIRTHIEPAVIRPEFFTLIQAGSGAAGIQPAADGFLPEQRKTFSGIHRRRRDDSQLPDWLAEGFQAQIERCQHRQPVINFRLCYLHPADMVLPVPDQQLFRTCRGFFLLNHQLPVIVVVAFADRDVFNSIRRADKQAVSALKTAVIINFDVEIAECDRICGQQAAQLSH